MIKKRISLFLQYFLFWYLFFVACKVSFLVYHFSLTKTLSFTDILKVILYGSKMDLSVAGYFMLLPGLLFIFTGFSRGRILARILTVYTGIILFLTGFLVVADMELYRFWGFRLDTTPLMYLSNPGEATASTSLLALVLLLLFWLVYCWIALRVFKKLIGRKIEALNSGNWTQSLIFIPLTACLIIPIRGSFGVAPMNIGFVYFHKTSVYANHAAVNVIWNVGYALSTYKKVKTVTYFEKDKAEKIFASNYADSGSTHYLLKTFRPNILVIIMESFTAKIIEPLGGKKGITPRLSALCKEGILFTNCYANGDRTDKGVISVLNGYPGQPTDAIINFPKKTESLPYLNKDLKKAGYYNEFVYGCDVDFANFRSYFMNAGYDKVISKDDFHPSLSNSKWGVHDHIVFERLLKECGNAPKEPFFISFLSMSSHEPFKVPMKTVIHGNDEESLYLNSAYYADSSLGNFIDKAKNTDWWKNTLIVIVADHGIRHPGNTAYYVPPKFHIPMLWLGGAIIKQDTIVSTYFSQCDFPLTLINQLKLDNKEYKFSQNFLSDKAPAFSYYIFNDGFGILKEDGQIVFDNITKKNIYTQGKNTDHLIEMGKAQMQILSSDFNRR